VAVVVQVVAVMVSQRQTIPPVRHLAAAAVVAAVREGQQPQLEQAAAAEAAEATHITHLLRQTLRLQPRFRLVLQVTLVQLVLAVWEAMVA
jgi:hypothetical protein